VLEHFSNPKSSIIASVRALLAERGFGAVTLQEILETASVTKGKFFHYFKSKDEFYMEVLRSALSERGTLHFKDVVKECPKGSCFERLIFLIDRIIEWHKSGLPEVMRLCVFATMFFGETELKPIRERLESNMNAISSLIKECQKSGELPHSLNSSILAAFFPACAIGSNTIQYIGKYENLTAQSLTELKNLLVLINASTRSK